MESGVRGELYAIISLTNNLGYHSGHGVMANVEIQRKFFDVQLAGRLTQEPKLDAFRGYRQTLQAGLKIHPWKKRLYVETGISYTAYMSQFRSGVRNSKVWSKASTSPYLGFGVENTKGWNAGVRYYFEESDTPNKVSSGEIYVQYRAPNKPIAVRLNVLDVSYLHNQKPGRGRQIILGFGWKF